MRDPSGLVVIEAICPSVSRYKTETEAFAVQMDWEPNKSRGQNSKPLTVVEIMEYQLRQAISEFVTYY